MYQGIDADNDRCQLYQLHKQKFPLPNVRQIVNFHRTKKKTADVSTRRLTKIQKFEKKSKALIPLLISYFLLLLFYILAEVKLNFIYAFSILKKKIKK